MLYIYNLRISSILATVFDFSNGRYLNWVSNIKRPCKELCCRVFDSVCIILQHIVICKIVFSFRSTVRIQNNIILYYMILHFITIIETKKEIWFHVFRFLCATLKKIYIYIYKIQNTPRSGWHVFNWIKSRSRYFIM